MSRFFADLHIHSKYSRATSPQMDIPNIAKWAKIKGIDLVAAPDWTHPQWLKELKKDLKPLCNGLFEHNNIKFILVTEISSIYKKGDKTRKIHNLIFAPDFKTVNKINKKLNKIGNLKSDGRPILGLDAKNLLEIVLTISKNCLIVPAHAWTPWFSIFGANSGFDSIQECFEEYSKHIYAIETGLSSDPPMNWRLSALDKITLISNSDAHSPIKLGREVNIFDCKLDYNSVINAIKKNKILKTLEFFPQEGKYHFDGHRSCKVCLAPSKTTICPKCGKPLTVGVVHRIQDLADRKKPKIQKKFINLIPLQEIISEALGFGPNTKTVMTEYENLIKKFGSEFNVLLDAPVQGIIGEAIMRVRNGKVIIQPGYDGEYGKITIFDKKEKQSFNKQKSLF